MCSCEIDMGNQNLYKIYEKLNTKKYACYAHKYVLFDPRYIDKTGQKKRYQHPMKQAPAEPYNHTRPE